VDAAAALRGIHALAREHEGLGVALPRRFRARRLFS
jgi:hypothetical protein